MKAKLIFIGKNKKTNIFFNKPKDQKPKIVIFQLRQFSIFFRENFRNWSLG